ncbi:MAG: hypothetical protein DRJ49_00235 [Thermoprotei archaeon]|nr:MAG: hypothetical protein DRJ49_00235 [Thermoprotei archaeon]
MMRAIMSGWGELDRLIGGLETGGIYILAGDSGSGKSTLAALFALTGATIGEPAVYITSTDQPSKITTWMESLGWNASRLIENDQLSIMRINLIVMGENAYKGVDNIYRELDRELDKIKGTRLVVDSLTSMFPQGTRYSREDMIKLFLGRIKERENLTTIATCDEELGHRLSEYADGLFILKLFTRRDLYIRTLTIRKIRWRDLSPITIEFDIRRSEDGYIRIELKESRTP